MLPSRYYREDFQVKRVACLEVFLPSFRVCGVTDLDWAAIDCLDEIDRHSFNTRPVAKKAAMSNAQPMGQEVSAGRATSTAT